MNELNFNTEDNFIQPSGRKNLEQLFDVEIKPNKGDESLRYVPPKTATSNEPKNEVGPRALWQTLLAKVVVGFKNGETVGRVGMAILRSIDNVYRIIVYKSKAVMLATLTVVERDAHSRHRPHLHRQNCYWQFYDDTGIYWSLLFERSTDESEFVDKLQECGIQMHLDIDVQPETVISVEELKKTEFPKSDGLVKSAPTSAPEPKQVRIKEERNIEHILDDDNLRSSSEYHHQRENLLSRLPKMGGQQLPQLNETNSTPFAINSTTECSDSSDQESAGERDSSLTIVGQPIYSPTRQQLHNHLVFPMNQTNTTTSQLSGSKNLVVQPLEAQVMQLMLVENRTQNTELRINIDKLDGKLEKVLDRIEKIQTGDSQEDEVIKLEEQILELKKENRRLKKEYQNATERSDTSVEQIWKIYDTELNSLGLNLATNIAYDIETLIGELLDKVTTQRAQLREKELQLKSTLTTAKEINDRYQLEKKSHNETIEKMEHLVNKMKTLQTTLDNKSKLEIELNERLNQQNTKHAAEITNVKLEMTQAVKDIMNNLYHTLAKNIVDMDRLVPEELLPLIGKTIRQETLAAVSKISK